MTIAIYERVSSKGQDFAAQHGDLERWAAQATKSKWYSDKFTGKTHNCPGFAKLQGDIERGNAKTLVVRRLDRLGRTAKALTALFDDLHHRGFELISLKEGLTLSSPAGRMTANVLASVAAFEAEVRAERQRAGIDAAKAAGKSRGGGK